MSASTEQQTPTILVDLDQEEILWWRKKIGVVRKKFVDGPKDLIDKHFISLKTQEDIKDRVKNTSSFIREVRETTWSRYIESELLFYKEVVHTLLEERTYLQGILEQSIEKDKLQEILKGGDSKDLINYQSLLFGEFAGRIFPYFYELSKSVTQSRRSRAGTEFEALISNVMEIYGYPYCNQSQLGQRTFEKKGLGKKVDGLVPSIDAFTKDRSKCLVITLKTTIRERWQEVVEELNRTNVPSIYLLTLDEGLTENTLKLMKNHNITLVTYKDIKDNFLDFSNVMSFESLFNEEIPHNLNWWKKKHPDLLD